MDRVVLDISHLRFLVEGSQEIAVLQQMDAFLPFLDKEGREYDFSIHFSQEWQEVSNTRELYAFDFSDADIRCRFVKKENLFLFYMQPGDSFSSTLQFRFTEGDTQVFAAVKDGSSLTDATMLRYALWFSYVLLSLPFQCTLIHSSVIVCRGQAVLFLGESGTGKSTHTRLWLKHIEGSRLLNDDCPAIHIVEGRPYVSGSPWSGKTACYHNRHFPLRAVVRLSQAPENKIRRLHTLEGFASLQPSCPPALAYDEKCTDAIIELISEVLGTTPVFHLACLPDEAAAQLSFSTIYPS